MRRNIRFTGGDSVKNTELHVGRAPKTKAKRRFPESFAFTLGVAFTVVYVVGLLATAGGERTQYTGDAVPVFAEVREDTPRTVWSALDDCLRDALGGGK